MAFPASRFAPAESGLPLRVPAGQGLTVPDGVDQSQAVTPAAAELPCVALEADRTVPPSGNLQIGGQQVWLGPALAGRRITIWVDETSLHVLLDGTRPKTLPSRLGVTELARLAADGPPSGRSAAAAVRHRHRDRGGTAGQRSRAGRPGRRPGKRRLRLAGQKVILRMDGTQMAVISHDGTLLRTMPCPVPGPDRARLRGARRAAASTRRDEAHHSVTITDSAIATLVRITVERIFDLLPGMAIELLDEAGRWPACEAFAK